MGCCALQHRISSPTLFAALLVAGCGSGRLAATPPLPLPAPVTAATSGAIWRPDSYAALTEDARARRIGDILTVRLAERTQASKSASAATSRSAEASLILPAAKPFSLVPKGLTSGGSAQSFSGDGTAAQSNRLDGDISVRVTEVLPGGVLRIAGRKLVGLNRGEEYVELTGLVRADDISPANDIISTRIAEARISYRGTGDIAQASRQGWFARLLGALSPF